MLNHQVIFYFIYLFFNLFKKKKKIIPGCQPYPTNPKLFLTVLFGFVQQDVLVSVDWNYKTWSSFIKKCEKSGQIIETARKKWKMADITAWDAFMLGSS